MYGAKFSKPQGCILKFTLKKNIKIILRFIPLYKQPLHLKTFDDTKYINLVLKIIIINNKNH